MHDAFRNGFSYLSDNISASLGGTISDEWINNVYSQIEQMCSDMFLEAENKPNTDIKQLQGWINEIWHKYTFNTNALIHNSQNRAVIPSAEDYASVDVAIQNKNKTILSTFSLKSDNSPGNSVRDQAKTPWESYCELKDKAFREGKEFKKTFDEFLRERGLKNDESVFMSKYFGQGKVVNSDMLKKAKEMAFKKYANALSNDEILARRYKEVYDTLTDVVSDGDGNESIRLTHKQAMRLAEAAKKGEMDEALLKECGLDVSKLVTASDIVKEAFRAGISAAAISAIIDLVPSIINVFSKIFRQEKITSDEFKKYGLKALSDSGRGFIIGSVTAAITACCKTGKLGENLINANTMGISSVVVIVVNTIMSGFKLATNRISRSEMVRELMQLYTTTGFAFIGGTVLACVCEGFPFAYLLGSFVGSVVGGLVYKLEDYLLISFCKEHNCTFFGLVEQDYKLPDDVLDEMGLNRFGFTKFEYHEFEPKRFEYKKFNYNRFKYEKFGIRVLKRDLIGVYKIGYVED